MNRMRGHVEQVAVMLVMLIAPQRICWAEWQAAPSASSAAQLSVMSGKIASIDLKQRRFTVKTGLMSSRDFVIDAETEVTDGLQPLTLERLQAGTDVTVEYRNRDGRHIAQSVTISGGSQAERPAATTPESAPRALP